MRFRIRENELNEGRYFVEYKNSIFAGWNHTKLDEDMTPLYYTSVEDALIEMQKTKVQYLQDMNARARVEDIKASSIKIPFYKEYEIEEI